MHPVRMAISSSISSASTCESHGARVAESETSSCLLICAPLEHPPCHADTCGRRTNSVPGIPICETRLAAAKPAEGQPDVERHLHLRLRGDSRMNDRSSAERWFFDAWSLFYDLPIAQRLTYQPCTMRSSATSVAPCRGRCSTWDAGPACWQNASIASFRRPGS